MQAVKSNSRPVSGAALAIYRNFRVTRKSHVHCNLIREQCGKTMLIDKLVRALTGGHDNGDCFRDKIDLGNSAQIYSFSIQDRRNVFV